MVLPAGTAFTACWIVGYCGNWLLHVPTITVLAGGTSANNWPTATTTKSARVTTQSFLLNTESPPFNFLFVNFWDSFEVARRKEVDFEGLIILACVPISNT